MKECKKCLEVKMNYQMFEKEIGFGLTVRTWLCKSCAKRHAYDACVKLSEELEKSFKPKLK